MKTFFYIMLFTLAGTLKMNSQTVYITDTGMKYHTKNCSALKSGKKPIALKQAVEKGYTPCKDCKADEVIMEEKQKKPAPRSKAA